MNLTLSRPVTAGDSTAPKECMLHDSMDGILTRAENRFARWELVLLSL